VSDGAVVGTYQVGGSPYGIAFDGHNIWTANKTSNTITGLRASDGHRFADIPLGEQPTGIVWDGSSLWVTNLFSNTVSKVTP